MYGLVLGRMVYGMSKTDMFTISEQDVKKINNPLSLNRFLSSLCLWR